MEGRITLTGQTGLYATVDATTHDGLIAVLKYVDAHPRGWASPAARKLLGVAVDVLGRSGISPTDGQTAAWELWSTTDMSECDNAWGYTVAAVRRRLGREEHAERKLTSVQGLRRAGADNVEFDDGADSLDVAAPETLEGPSSRITNPALVSVRQLLVMAGFDADTSAEIVQTIVDMVGDSTNLSAACDRLSRARDVAARYGLTHSQWRALISMLLGTTRGQPGLFVLTSRGHPAPLEVRHIRGARRRFFAQTPTLAAAS